MCRGSADLQRSGRRRHLKEAKPLPRQSAPAVPLRESPGAGGAAGANCLPADTNIASMRSGNLGNKQYQLWYFSVMRGNCAN